MTDQAVPGSSFEGYKQNLQVNEMSDFGYR